MPLPFRWKACLRMFTIYTHPHTTHTTHTIRLASKAGLDWRQAQPSSVSLGSHKVPSSLCFPSVCVPATPLSLCLPSAPPPTPLSLCASCSYLMQQLVPVLHLVGPVGLFGWALGGPLLEERAHHGVQATRTHQARLGRRMPDRRIDRGRGEGVRAGGRKGEGGGEGMLRRPTAWRCIILPTA